MERMVWMDRGRDRERLQSGIFRKGMPYYCCLRNCYCLRLRDMPLPSRLKCCSRTRAAENSSAGVASKAVHSCHILSRLTDFFAALHAPNVRPVHLSRKCKILLAHILSFAEFPDSPTKRKPLNISIVRFHAVHRPSESARYQRIISRKSKNSL